MSSQTERHQDSVSQQKTLQGAASQKSFEQRLRSMSTSELIQELGTLKWHYALLKDKKKFEMACAVEMEIARRKGSLSPSKSNSAER